VIFLLSCLFFLLRRWRPNRELGSTNVTAQAWKMCIITHSTRHHNLHSFSPLPPGRTTTAQGVNCRLFTAAVCVNPVGVHVAFMNKLVLGGFSSSTTVFPVIYHSASVSHTFITREWYNEPICVRSILELVSLYFYVKQWKMANVWYRDRHDWC